MHEEFQQGEIVRLKSGGPDMTVQGRAGDDFVCQWFAGKKLERGFFAPETLERVERGEGDDEEE